MGATLRLYVASTGLGAMVLNPFGTQPYTRVSPPLTPSPALPLAGEEEAAKLETLEEARPDALDELDETDPKVLEELADTEP